MQNVKLSSRNGAAGGRTVTLLEKAGYTKSQIYGKIKGHIVEIDDVYLEDIFNKQNGKLTQSYKAIYYNLQNLPDNSADCIDNEKPSMDTKLGNHFIPSRSTHSNEANQEAFDLQTYKKFLSFLKFQEMMDKYNTQ